MSLHAARIGHAYKAAATRGGESVIPSKAKAKRGAAQLGASLLKEAHSTSLPSVAKSSSAANKNPAMETDDKELPEDLDDVTMIADPDDEVDNESG